MRQTTTTMAIRTIEVHGDSMSPTYNPGDWLLFRTLSLATAVKLSKLINLVGKVVILERDSMPGILQIKRVIRIEENALWVEGDNKTFSTDSRSWGVVAPTEIRGVVLLRYKAEQVSNKQF